MTVSRIRLLLPVVFVTLFGSTAFAADPPPDPLAQRSAAFDKIASHKPPRPDHAEGLRKTMARLDVDKDGRISREEAKADPKFAARFDALDADKNGFVDRADLDAGRQQRRDAWFARADTDKDGKLSKAEFDAASARRGQGWHEPKRDGQLVPSKPMPPKPVEQNR